MVWHTWILYFCLLNFLMVTGSNGVEVTYDGRAIKIDGQRKILISGSIHYPRSTPEMWPDLIQKAKEGGLDAIETYVFWNAHEPVRGQYDFTGNNDIIKFLKTIQEAGLYAVLRIGPYVCAEWNYGGIPVWVHNLPGVEIRTANDVFMNEMQNFTTLIVNMLQKEMLFASQGGPVIIAQIENEYGNVMSSYGDNGKTYINWCAEMAESLNIGVPWIMCQQDNAPQPMINTCNGYYCDDFQPNNQNSPKMWTENWVGWYKNWGGKDPHRTAEDVAFAVARFFQRGGTFQNYYMYHGGTNFGRTAGGPFITTSYDYDAPLNEYGNIAQPKWGHLKQLHSALKKMEKSLTYGNVSDIDLGNSVNATVYFTNEKSSCFFSNINTKADAIVTYGGKNYTIPAWSVSLLPDCQNEEYNTAKVNVQTSNMGYRPNDAEEEPKSLKWLWRPEVIDDGLFGSKSSSSANALLDQKQVTADASDYLWYTTKLDLFQGDPMIWSNSTSLRINGTGLHVIHAFVNGKHIGSRYGLNNDQFEANLKLNQGQNIISLFSVTVGLQNYGAFYDLGLDGVVGPIDILCKKGDEIITRSLSSHTWSYKFGLDGWDRKLFSEDPTHNYYRHPSTYKWMPYHFPANRSFTWYKAEFKAPTGKEAVVLDLYGMAKGYAWVNGNNLGRYWPTYLTSREGCTNAQCDYRGPYSANKCVSKCGEPTQRWYHVPRSFLRDGSNTLVLFEEIGGNPGVVNFQTVSVDSVCATVYENKTLELSCHYRPISAIKFASFGNPRGACGKFSKGTCDSAKDVASILHEACVGKDSCAIDVSAETFGPTTCRGMAKRLAVEAICA